MNLPEDFKKLNAAVPETNPGMGHLVK